MSYSIVTTPLNPFKWSTSNPTQMSPTKITTKPLVIMSSGLLVDHSKKNTTSMDLIVIFIKFLFFPLLHANGMGHMFFDQMLGMQL